MIITRNREQTAYDKIDRLTETDVDTGWFLTPEGLERIKKDTDKYYEFALYILEICTPVTPDEKVVYRELNDYMKTVQAE